MPKVMYLCVLGVFMLSSLVKTWDIAIGVKDEIQFFKENGSTAGIARQQFKDVKIIAYDFLNETLYFGDNKHNNVSIFAFHMAGRRSIEHIVKKNLRHNILGLSVDPISQKLFWTVQNSDNIYWMSLKPGSNNGSGVGQIFLNLNGNFPQHIVVDSCRGNIYWTNYKGNNSTIEMASVNGTDRKIIIPNDLFHPMGIALHQGMNKIFWSDHNNNFKIESADLDGGNRQVLFDGSHHHPYHIAVSKKAVYWTDWTYKKVWMLPLGKNSSKIAEFRSYGYDSPTGIIVNDDLLEQTENIPECSHVHDFIMNKFKLYRNGEGDDNIVSNVDTPQYILDYCKDIDEYNSTEKCKSIVSSYPYMLCYNYCFNGTCFIDNDNTPKCSCSNGYYGDRCQYDLCYDHCLNNGWCIVEEQGFVSCQCAGDWVGDRCEINNQTLFQNISCTTKDDNGANVVSVSSPEDVMKVNKKVDNNYTTKLDSKESTGQAEDSNRSKKVREEPSLSENSVVQSEQSTTDINKSEEFGDKESFRILEEISASHMELMSETQCLTIIVCLSLLTFGFCASTVVLAFKVIALKKRPRINKRFIVNKNVTPLTSRPQCEVTIENCCNMNICETPCFEPSDFMEEVNEASRKEEKKNLLLNIQHNEDTY